nr:PREDICTED: MAP6 domain-containing protein 1 [Latimeria chalumnae]|eukprot:XP_005991269.1 PREDICTED: MAP6 domain-containing protein 1 [Latimeria chalumnae]
MAWPCISRVCCLARFWNQIDKSDLSVPLTIQNYSEIADQEEIHSVTREVPNDGSLRAGRELGLDSRRNSPGHRESGPRRSWKGRRSRQGYQSPSEPFSTETQYMQDFKAWPIPKRECFPWISNGGRKGEEVPAPMPGSSSSHNLHLLPPGGKQRERRQDTNKHRLLLEDGQIDTFKITSYRQEFRPWTGVKPSKPIKNKQMYVPPQEKVPLETSYRAAFKGDIFKKMETLQVVTSPSQNQLMVQPNSVGLLNQPGNSEPVVKTKLTPNTSAVFQSGSRILNV